MFPLRGAQVQSLAQELRCHMLLGTAKKKKKRERNQAKELELSFTAGQ